MNPRIAAALRALAGPLIICLAALFAILPEIGRGSSCGHDFDFHLVSWFDALASWKQGVFYPHWAPSPNYNAGEPRFIFYPPLTWMLGAAIGAIVEWKYVAVVLTWLMLAGTGIATYALARHALARRPATLAGCIALFSGYSLFNAYERTAFGELMGGIWIPLLLLFALRDRRPGSRLMARACDGSTVPLALAVAGAWFSGVPLGVMVCYFLAAVVLLCAWLRRSWAPILRAAMAVALGISLAGLYLLPAIVQQKWVDVHEATSDPGTRIEDSWLFTHHADPSLDLHDLELFRVSAIGVTVIAVGVMCALVAWKRKRLPGSRAFWIPLATIPLAVLLLQLPVSMPLWKLLPKMSFLQFPWRWYVTLQAPVGVLAASALWIERRWLRWLEMAGLAFAALCVTIFAGLNLFQQCFPEDAPWTMADNYAAHTGFEGTDEYAPPFADNSLVALGLPPACLAETATVPLGTASAGLTPQWEPEQASCAATFALKPSGAPAAEHMQVDFDAQRAAFLIVRLRSYPAWRVALNGKQLTNLPEREDGLLAVPVAPGHGTLRIDWTLSASDELGRWLSALSLFALIALAFAERKPSRVHLS